MNKQSGKKNHFGYRPKAGNILKLQSYFGQGKQNTQQNSSLVKITKTKKS